MHPGERLSFDLPAHPQTTAEEADRIAPRERLTHKKPKSRIIGALAVAASLPLHIVALNASYLFGSRDTLSPVIAGCEAPDVDSLGEIGVNWNPPPAVVEELEQIEQKSREVASGARGFRPSSRPDNSAPRGKDILLVPWNFPYQLSEFTMKRSGITVQVYTNKEDSGIKVNSEIITEIFEEPLDKWYVFSDKSTRDFMHCARGALLEDRDRAGTELKVYLPAEPNYCINGAFAVQFGDNMERDSTCLTSGGNMPNLDFGILDQFFEPHLLFVSGRNTDPLEASRKATNLLMHELGGHEEQAQMGTKPLLDQDEQHSRVVEKQLAATRTGPLGLAFEYPGTFCRFVIRC